MVIDEPQGDTVATVRFDLWLEQVRALAAIVVAKLVLLLKARQIGITWLVLAYILWLCLFKPGRVGLLFSKTELDAYELVRRIKVMYERLPEWMRLRVPLTRDSSGSLEWANESRVQSLAATKAAGRSFTASVAFCDEFAFMQWADELYTALKPTIDAGGQLIINSTANGETGLFHDLWEKAEKKLNNFINLFLSWRARPDRDEAWRQRVREEAISAALDQQEYPETPAEAFQNTGGEPFLPSIEWWTRQKDTLPPLTPTEPCVLAGDAATGRLNEASDCFALVLVSEHPTKEGQTAVRYARKWQAAKGQRIDFEGTEDDPGPLREVRRLHNEYSLLQFAYDPTELRYAAGLIAQEALWCEEVSQGAEQMSFDKELLDAIIQRTLWHDGDEDLTDHLRNADRKVNPEDKKLRIVKRTEAKKIDLAKALSMANGRLRKLLAL